MILYKEDVARLIAERSGLSKKNVTEVLDLFISVVSESLTKYDRVQLTGFGTFEPKCRNARIGRNPHTGEEVLIPSRMVPSFKPGKNLKNMIQ